MKIKLLFHMLFQFHDNNGQELIFHQKSIYIFCSIEDKDIPQQFSIASIIKMDGHSIAHT